MTAILRRCLPLVTAAALMGGVAASAGASTPGFTTCPNEPNMLMWHIQVHGSTCRVADSAAHEGAKTKVKSLGHGLYSYTSTTGFSCREKTFHGDAQDGEVQLWDCKKGTVEVLSSDTPAVASKKL